MISVVSLLFRQDVSSSKIMFGKSCPNTLPGKGSGLIPKKLPSANTLHFLAEHRIEKSIIIMEGLLVLSNRNEIRIGYALTCDGLKRLAAGNNTNKGGEKEGMLTVIFFSPFAII